MKSLLKIMLAVLLATWIVPAIMAADGNFTGYPDGQYIWIANPELRIRDQGQIGWGMEPGQLRMLHLVMTA